MGTARPATEELAPTAIEDEELVFRLNDPAHEHDAVKVWCDLELASSSTWPRSRVAGSCGCRCRTSTAWSTSSTSTARLPRSGQPRAGRGGVRSALVAGHARLRSAGLARRARAARPAAPADRGRGRRRRSGSPRGSRASHCRCCSSTTAPRWTPTAALTSYVGACVAAAAAADAGRSGPGHRRATRGTPPTRRTPPRWSTRSCRPSPTPSRPGGDRCCWARAWVHWRRCMPPGPTPGTFAGLFLQ